MVYGLPITFVDELPEISPRVRDWTVWSGREWIEIRCRSGHNCIMNPEVVLRTSVQHEIGGYDARLPHSGDLEMWLRAAAVSDIGRVNGAAQGFYRIHRSSMQRTTYAGHLNDLEGRLDAFEKILVGPEARVPDGEELFETAKRALAASALECARSAFDHGRATQEPVDDYMEFAARMQPDVRKTRKWRSLGRSAAADPCRVDRGLVLVARRIVEDLRWRVRWRRWRWTGV